MSEGTDGLAQISPYTWQAKSLDPKMEVFPARLLIDGIPAAGLVLSPDYTILAANERMASLTGLSDYGNNPDWLLGKAISSLPIVLVPVSQPVLRDWESLFEAARARLLPKREHPDPHHDPSLPASGLPGQSYLGDDVESASFWQNEDGKELAMLDTFIYPNAGPSSGWYPGSHRRIRSRMCIRAVTWSSKLRYIVTFRRPLNVRQTTAQILPAMKESEITIMEGQGHAQLVHDTDGQTEDLTSIVSELIPNCMAVCDNDGQVVYLSPSWYAFTGLTPDESLGTGWAQAVHPDDVGPLAADWADAIKSDRNHWTYEARYRMKSGEYVYFLIRAQPARDENGVCQKWYASMLDVNELVSARLESNLRRQALVTLLSQADISLWGLDRSRKLYMREGRLPWDPTCSLTTAIRSPSPSDRDRTPQTQQSHPDLPTTIRDILYDKPFDSYVEHQEGDRWYRTRLVADTRQGNVSATDVETGSAVLGFTIDVTDVKARAKLQIDNERLAASSRAASESTELKSRFLANMSHEIRTPISGILGLCEMLGDTQLTSQQKHLCDDVTNSASFLLTLVNDVLDFSKIEASHMDIEAIPFCPAKVVSHIASFMTFAAKKKNITLSLSNLLGQDVVVIGDSRRLQQVLTNLLSNAIKFTDSGSVSLAVRPINQRLRSLRSSRTIQREASLDEVMSTNNEDEFIIQFQVKDTGCGIDDETMSKLFQPFTQADSSTARKHGGTGLGLTISRQLVELMGGKIELASTVGAGSTATVHIPYKLPNHHDPGQSDSLTPLPANSELDLDVIMSSDTTLSTQHPPFSTTSYGDSNSAQPTSDKHVLVVEDNAINQKVALYALQRLGYPATAVWNGREAIDYLIKAATDADSMQPQPDIILMDCMMPVMDGYQATRLLREGGDAGEIPEAIRNTPIIAMTASTTKGDRERCEQAGMTDYLSKPVVRDELQKMLTRYTGPAT